jgi:hypothetical protein
LGQLHRFQLIKEKSRFERVNPLIASETVALMVLTDADLFKAIQINHESIVDQLKFMFDLGIDATHRRKSRFEI